MGYNFPERKSAPSMRNVSIKVTRSTEKKQGTRGCTLFLVFQRKGEIKFSGRRDARKRARGLELNDGWTSLPLKYGDQIFAVTHTTNLIPTYV